MIGWQTKSETLVMKSIMFTFQAKKGNFLFWVQKQKRILTSCHEITFCRTSIWTNSYQIPLICNMHNKNHGLSKHIWLSLVYLIKVVFTSFSMPFVFHLFLIQSFEQNHQNSSVLTLRTCWYVFKNKINKRDGRMRHNEAFSYLLWCITLLWLRSIPWVLYIKFYISIVFVY